MKLEAAKTLGETRNNLVEAKTALKYTRQALDKAEESVTVYQLRKVVMPLLKELKGDVPPSKHDIPGSTKVILSCA